MLWKLKLSLYLYLQLFRLLLFFIIHNYFLWIFSKTLESVSMLDRPSCTYHIPYKSSGYETFQVVIHFLVLLDVENLCKTWDIKANQAPQTVNWESTSTSKFQINVTIEFQTMQYTCNAWSPLHFTPVWFRISA